ncbi:hypothetical protein GQ42DRAFT_159911 [Ramicandelaber brevisporus]|nr:hypothetical protein GQ42DRAFT_159911 [Ramicandelaber brevisporus]
MSSQALLLRLFTSQFFNSWLAVSYLFKYPASVGIQHYLCERLAKCPTEELEFFIPQLCHFLITQPDNAIALEAFLLDLCRSSTHIALLTYWFFQAYLSDLLGQPHTPSFRVCRRVFNECQQILFASGSNRNIRSITNDTEAGAGGEATQDQDESSALPISQTGWSPHRQPVRENVQAAIIGMGAILAAFGMPELSQHIGRMATVQGRRTRSLSRVMDDLIDMTDSLTVARPRHQPPAIEQTPKIVAPALGASDATIASEERKFDSPALESDQDVSTPDMVATAQQQAQQQQPPQIGKTRAHTTVEKVQMATRAPTLLEMHKGNAFSTRKYLADDSVTLTSSSGSVPLVERSASYAVAESTATATEAALVTSHPATSGSGGGSSGGADMHFASQIQFVTTLVDISNRVCIVARPGRPASLKAELTLLNHNLPADVCLPLWCPAEHGDCKAMHHRIVRISPDDAVVLNSAERAPYLVMVEVLDNERRTAEELRLIKSVQTAVSPSDSTDENGDGERAEGQAAGGTSPRYADASKVTEWAFEDGRESTDSEVGVIQTVPQQPQQRQPAATASASSASASTSASAASSVPLGNDDFSERMRTAAILLAQITQTGGRSSGAGVAGDNGSSNNPAGGPSNDGPGMMAALKNPGMEEIRARIVREMLAMEEERLNKLATAPVIAAAAPAAITAATSPTSDTEPNSNSTATAANKTSDASAPADDPEAIKRQEALMAAARKKDDQNAAAFRENWDVKRERIRKSSPYGHLTNWHLFSVIVKTGADLRQEQLALQLILSMQRIWEEEQLDIWVKYYRILVTSNNSGLVETIQNTISVHLMRKDAYARRMNALGQEFTISDYFIREYGVPGSPDFMVAQHNFMVSLVGYSLVTYILALKDRHNGNILLDTQGHLVHIDFGFMLSNSPGSVNFESAPFKLTQEYIDLLGGMESAKFAEFKALLKKGFMALRKYAERIIMLVEMMQIDSKLPCFALGPASVTQLRDRFHLSLTEQQVSDLVEKMVASSACNSYTRLYDAFQYYTNGYL